MKMPVTLCLLLLTLLSCKKEETPQKAPSLTIPLHETTIAVITDSLNGGSSSVTYTKEQKHLHFTAKTGDDRKMPYPYWDINLAPKGSRWDIAPFTKVILSFDTTNTFPREGIELKLWYSIEGFTDTTKSMTFAPSCFIITKPNKRLTIPLKNFTIPQWWYAMNKTPKEDIAKAPKSLSHISFGNADYRGGGSYSIGVKSILFQ